MESEAANKTKCCPYCGKEIVATAVKCKHCNKWLETNTKADNVNFINCPICDEVISIHAKKCPHCNEKIDVLIKSQHRKRETEAVLNTNNSKQNHSWWYVIIPLILLLIAGGGYLFYNHQKDTQNIELLTQFKIDSITITGLVTQWNVAHCDRDIEALRSLYAQNVKYYQAEYTKDQVLENKNRYFRKNPNRQQSCYNLQLQEINVNLYRIDFQKQSWVEYTNDIPKEYPSYLYIQKNMGIWQIIEESDKITDANLAKYKRK